MTIERRKQTRLPLELPAEISFENQLFIGETSNLSLLGVRVVTDDLLERGATVYVTLTVPRSEEDEDDDPFETSATVRWTKERPDGRCVAGLQFGPLTAAQRKDLALLIEAASNAA